MALCAAHDGRRKPAVEAGHQHRSLGVVGIERLDRGRSSSVIASGFSTKTCLPALKARSVISACRSWRVAISTRSICRIVKHRVEIGRCVGGAEPLGRAARRKAGAADDRTQLEAFLQLLQIGQMHALREAAGADQRQPDRCRSSAGGGATCKRRAGGRFARRDISSSTSSGLWPSPRAAA